MTPSSAASPPASIGARFQSVSRRIEAAARAVGRDPAAVTLIAVSKAQSPEAIDAALAAGQVVFGENRVQEAQNRWGNRRAALPGLSLRLIGPLQTNKAADAVGLFDVIETLDREKLARALADAIQKTGRSPRLLIQINTGAEVQKAGVAPSDLANLLNAVRRIYGLAVEGLMSIPPVDNPPDPHFALLAELAERHGLPVVSMGMSGDFEAAIRHGATHVRVGSALFGERNRPPAPSSG